MRGIVPITQAWPGRRARLEGGPVGQALRLPGLAEVLGRREDVALLERQGDAGALAMSWRVFLELPYGQVVAAKGGQDQLTGFIDHVPEDLEMVTRLGSVRHRDQATDCVPGRFEIHASRTPRASTSVL